MVVKSFDSGISALLPFEASSHRLLVEWTPAHVHVLLWHPHEHRLVATESFSGRFTHAEALDEMAGQSRLLQYTDVPLTLANATLRAMPVPQPAYAAHTAEQELAALFGEQPDMVTYAHALPALDMIWLSQLPQPVQQWLNQRFQQVHYSHAAALLLQKGETAEGGLGHLIVYDAYIWCLLWQAGQLRYAWHIPILSPDDLVYRLLNLCQQHQLNPAEVIWHLSGMVEKDAPLYQGLDKFLAQLQVAQPQTELPPQVPAHYLAHLLQAVL